jgi:hypothetical protein
MANVFKFKEFQILEKDGWNNLKKDVAHTYNVATTTGTESRSKAGSISTNVGSKKADINSLTLMKNKPEHLITKTLIKGKNPFFDADTGYLEPLDKVLPSNQLDKVIELWKSDQKEAAANILLNYGRRKRNQQFNTGLASLMGGLCMLNPALCISRLKDKTSEYVEHLPYKAALSDKGQSYAFQDIGKIWNWHEATKIPTDFTVDAPKENLTKLFSALKEKGVSPEKWFQATASLSPADAAKHVKVLQKLLVDPANSTIGDVFNTAKETYGVPGQMFQLPTNGHAEAERIIGDMFGKDVIKKAVEKGGIALRSLFAMTPMAASTITPTAAGERKKENKKETTTEIESEKSTNNESLQNFEKFLKKF